MTPRSRQQQYPTRLDHRVSIRQLIPVDFARRRAGSMPGTAAGLLLHGKTQMNEARLIAALDRLENPAAFQVVAKDLDELIEFFTSITSILRAAAFFGSENQRRFPSLPRLNHRTREIVQAMGGPISTGVQELSYLGPYDPTKADRIHMLANAALKATESLVELFDRAPPSSFIEAASKPTSESSATVERAGGPPETISRNSASDEAQGISSSTAEEDSAIEPNDEFPKPESPFEETDPDQKKLKAKRFLEFHAFELNKVQGLKRPAVAKELRQKHIDVMKILHSGEFVDGAYPSPPTITKWCDAEKSRRESQNLAVNKK
ncbi:hypothetical protein RISK_002341 [Rhodopirellula islandica]|uniref:Uncharacterized protein n=1 Tax=Rhodopirellula islandica TaxID=595434 RepID=A0A0J1EJL6_RHOIS|nr:hypothetical protein [Rhodopirellula islandica]KLU05709.1 hypothetical protein RISK_002341 [Rhodopirellula islandica]